MGASSLGTLGTLTVHAGGSGRGRGSETRGLLSTMGPLLFLFFFFFWGGGGGGGWGGVGVILNHMGKKQVSGAGFDPQCFSSAWQPGFQASLNSLHNGSCFPDPKQS